MHFGAIWRCKAAISDVIPADLALSYTKDSAIIDTNNMSRRKVWSSYLFALSQTPHFSTLNLYNSDIVFIKTKVEDVSAYSLKYKIKPREE